MEKGQKVTVYQDPMTEQKPEGEAILLRKLGEDPPEANPRLEAWWVRFLEDGFETNRLIKAGEA